MAHDGIAPGKPDFRLPVVSGASGQAAKEEQLSAAPTYILRACGWLIRHINMLGLWSHLGCTGFVNQFTGLLQSIIWMIGEHVCHFDSFIDLYFPSRLPCLCWEQPFFYGDMGDGYRYSHLLVISPRSGLWNKTLGCRMGMQPWRFHPEQLRLVFLSAPTATFSQACSPIVDIFFIYLPFSQCRPIVEILCSQ